jgi:hypothetical protein
VQAILVTSDGASPLGGSARFEVKPVPTAPAGTDFIAVAAFQLRTSELQRRINGINGEVGRVRERLRHMRAALLRTPRADAALLPRMDRFEALLNALTLRLQGDPIRGSLNESSVPSISNRVGNVVGGHWETRQAPTATQRQNIEIAERDFDSLSTELAGLIDGELMAIERALAAAGAPWSPGGRIGG